MAVLQQGEKNLVDLYSEFSGGREDESSESVRVGPVLSVEVFYDWNQEGKGFTRAGLGTHQDVSLL